MATIGALNVDLTMETVAFQRDISKAVSSLKSGSDQMQSSLARLEAKANSFASTVKGTLVAALSYQAVKGFAEFVRGSLEATGGLGEFAQQLGVSTDFLQEMQYAATQVGLSQDDLATSFAKLTANIGGALEGNKQLQLSFKNLGVSIVDAGGNVKSTEDVFREVVAAISKIPNAAQRAAAAKDLMGKSAQKMMPLLEGGAQGLRDMEKAARDAGAVIDGSTIEAADKAADAIAALEIQSKKLADSIIAESATAIYELTQRVKELSESEGFRTGLNSIRDAVIGIGLAAISGIEQIGNLINVLKNPSLANLKKVYDGSVFGVLGKLGTNKFDNANIVNGPIAPPPPGVTFGKDTSSGGGKRASFLSQEDVNNAKADAKVIKELSDQLLHFADARAQAIDQAVKRLSDTASPEAVSKVRALAAQIFDSKAQKDLTDSINDTIKSYDDQAAVLRMTASDAEAYRVEQSLLNEQIRRFGTVSAEARAQIEAAGEAVRTRVAQTDAEAKIYQREVELSDQLRQGLLDVGTAGIEGFDSMADAARRFTQQILEAIVQMYVLKPLIESVLGEGGTSAFGAGGLGGIIGSIFGSGGAGASSSGLVFGPLPAFASGGVSDKPGIFAESGPEAAVPLPDGRSIPVTLNGSPAPANVSVHVVNNAPAEVSTDSQTGANGETYLRIVVNEVKKETAKGGFDAANRTRFGVVPRRVKR